MTRLRPSLFVLCLLVGSVLGAGVAGVAQRARGRAESAPPSGGGRGAADSDDEDEDASDAESQVVTEQGGAKVKVIRFSGLDISGRLKSPQLLYFLNRMRAEFDRPRLPHRSFVPELVRSERDSRL